ncbi:hypothetical protein PV08_06149 [Exophiala spinifera]|uniref:Major facilitator superfamily (MFS) profile domain-containing protein n=1 Tax=Exophiala spinifera TaxID=91928 RepID=A0A0D2BAV3_9EURO|nr:uncharacterized protein PV08_06149 [Exophiala spinifera]KIW16098.1 hypothetical protein PV08_06149 [Exophiala spinifera]
MTSQPFAASSIGLDNMKLPSDLEQISGLTVQQTKAGFPTLVVSFEGPNDPMNAQNWSASKKLRNFLAYSYPCFVTSFSSGALSPATGQIAKDFHVSPEVALLSTTTLFLLGYTGGPFVWGPSSDYYGRKIPMMISVFGALCFGAGASSAKDYQTLSLCRFFQGAFGSCGIVIPMAAFADMLNPEFCGYAAIVFVFIVLSGPLIASPISGFTVDNDSLNWRWCSWWTVFANALALVCMSSVVESYTPYLLQQKALKLRHTTGEFSIHAPLDENKRSLKQVLKMLATLPFIMGAKEPILALISIYLAFVYALVYVFLISYDLVFIDGYHMSSGVGGLTLLSLVLGCGLGVAASILDQRRMFHKMASNGGLMIPEWRMPLCSAGAVAFALGLFFFGWTGAYPDHIHWIVPVTSGLVTGFGLLVISYCMFSFIIDVYKINSGPALAMNAIVRSSLGAGFPLFARQMFENLGIQYASTLLGCLAAVMIPVPFAFWRWGPRIRARSTFAMASPPSDAIKAENRGMRADN